MAIERAPGRGRREPARDHRGLRHLIDADVPASEQIGIEAEEHLVGDQHDRVVGGAIAREGIPNAALDGAELRLARVDGVDRDPDIARPS
jgi:hypothetical protein